MPGTACWGLNVFFCTSKYYCIPATASCLLLLAWYTPATARCLWHAWLCMTKMISRIGRKHSGWFGRIPPNKTRAQVHTGGKVQTAHTVARYTVSFLQFWKGETHGVVGGGGWGVVNRQEPTNHPSTTDWVQGSCSGP
jgi:hypothetical protein